MHWPVTLEPGSTLMLIPNRKCTIILTANHSGQWGQNHEYSTGESMGSDGRQRAVERVKGAERQRGYAELIRGNEGVSARADCRFVPERGHLPHATA